MSDNEILEYLASGRLVIENLSIYSLTSNGYDLRIAEIRLQESGDAWTGGVVRIPPTKTFHVSTVEFVCLPSD